MRLNIHESIYAAILNYMRRHNWEQPAKIVMSKDAFMKVLSKDLIDFRNFPETYMGIPLNITFEPGIHIHLCEPSINLFPEIYENVIRTNKENANV